jgi:hypothetical protein
MSVFPTPGMLMVSFPMSVVPGYAFWISASTFGMFSVVGGYCPRIRPTTYLGVWWDSSPHFLASQPGGGGPLGLTV